MRFSLYQWGSIKCLHFRHINWLHERIREPNFLCDAASRSNSRKRNQGKGSVFVRFCSIAASATEKRRQEEEKEVRTDLDLLAQLVIKEVLSSHRIMQAKVSASYRWKMASLQMHILSASLSLSHLIPLRFLSVYLSLPGWMSLILRWLETKPDFLTAEHSLLCLTRGIKTKPLLILLLSCYISSLSLTYLSPFSSVSLSVPLQKHLIDCLNASHHVYERVEGVDSNRHVQSLTLSLDEWL